MNKKKVVAAPEKQHITGVVVCDTNRLYDSLPSAIRYLEEVARDNPGLEDAPALPLPSGRPS